MVMVKVMQINWKTSGLGFCGLLTSVGALGTDLLSGNYSTIVMHLPAIAASLGLMFAKDSTAAVK
ncbi:hypothetical protein [Schlesneria paludicola]|uniref:hypothetical protein n=1 Tax=Schlesneria paludicola TaxID=360056 RepID=UPI000299D447|nr:hypothetical protein [Schlesneria paludicola]